MYIYTTLFLQTMGTHTRMSRDPVVKVLKLFDELHELHESGVEFAEIKLPDEFNYPEIGGSRKQIPSRQFDKFLKLITKVKAACRIYNTKRPMKRKSKSKANKLDQMLKTKDVIEFMRANEISAEVATKLIGILTHKPSPTTPKNKIFMEVAAELKRFAEKDEFKKAIPTYGEIVAKYNAVTKGDTKGSRMDLKLFRQLLGKKNGETVTVEPKARITTKSIATLWGRKPTDDEWDGVQREIARMMCYSGRMIWREFRANARAIAFAQNEKLTLSQLFDMYNHMWNEVCPSRPLMLLLL